MRILTFLLGFLLLSGICSARIIYVKYDATGANNGSSWNNAFSSLNVAISSSSSGDTLWIARGTYIPASFTSFAILPGRVYIGNFKGTETRLNDRDPNDLSARTFLDGNNNVRHILTRDEQNFGSGNEAILDGFTIQKGYAVPDADNNPESDNGSAASIRGGFVTFKNCVFANNYTKGGGAVNLYIYQSNIFTPQNTRISFHGCRFTNNQTDFLTGNVGRSVSTSIGASTQPLAEFIFEQCSFTETDHYNTSFPGSIVSVESSKSSFSNCVFDNVNYTSIDLSYGQTAIDSCTFTNNTGYYTGCFALSGTSGSVTNCKFTGALNSYGNSFVAGPSVGSINVTSNLLVENCIFDNNTSYGNYGALLIGGTGSVTMNKCTFTNNKTKVVSGSSQLALYGAGLSVGNNASLKASNCLFFNNSLDTNPFGFSKYGGAVYAGGAGNANLLNCTLINNKAVNGGAVYVNYMNSSSALRITNSILWNNKVMIDTNLNTGNPSYDFVASSIEREGYYPSRVIVSSSLIQTGKCGWSSYCGATEMTNCILNQDPLFVDTTQKNFHLKVCSPAVNVGNKDSIAALTTDFDGNVRWQGVLPDLGIYENKDLSVSDFFKNTSLGTAFSFSSSDFISNYLDPTGTLKKIKIISLPLEGKLLLNGNEFKVPLNVLVADISKLSFTEDSCIGSQTSFKWLGTAGDSCSYKDTAKVTINTGGGIYTRPNKPIITYAVPLPQFCAGDSLALQVTAGYNRYLWSNGNASNKIMVKQSGKYFVKVYDHCYSQTSDTITMTSRPIPTPLISNDGSRCLAGPTSVQISGGYNYAWYADSLGNSVLSTGATYTYNYLAENDTIYLVAEKDGCYSKRYQIVSYVDAIPPKPVVLDTSHCENASARLAIKNYNADYLYKLYILRGSNAVAIASGGNTGAVKTIAPAIIKKDSIVLVKAIGIACTSAVDTVKVKVFSQPPQPSISNSGSLCFLDSMQLFGPVGYKRYAWIVFLDPDSSYTKTITQNQIYLKQSSEVAMFVYDEHQCISPVSQSVFITASNVPMPIVQQDGDSLKTSVGFALYQWYFNGQPMTDNGAAIYPKESGSYSVQLLDTNGCSSHISVPFILTLPDLPVTGIQNSKSNFYKVEVYPNPANNILNIECKTEESIYITLVNSHGIVMKEGMYAQLKTIDISSLSSGLYILKLSGERNSTVVKVIKN